jgi:hypothetical protein
MYQENKLLKDGADLSASRGSTCDPGWGGGFNTLLCDPHHSER